MSFQLDDGARFRLERTAVGDVEAAAVEEDSLA